MRRLVGSGGWLGLGLGLAVLALAGCGGDDSSGDDGSGGSAADTGGATTMPATSSNVTTSDPNTGSGGGGGSGTTAPGTSGPSGTSTGEATTMPADSSGGNDTAMGCEPPGDACLDCVVTNCCEAWLTCQADPGCACTIDCHVVQGNSIGSCKSQCDHDGELYNGVFFCGQQTCLGLCDWAVG